MKKSVKIIIGVLIIALVGASVFLIIKNVSKNKNNDTTTTTTTKASVVKPKASESKFSYSEESGYAVLTGYAEKKHIKIEADEDNEGMEADYVYFHITNSDNEDFMKYVNGLKGNLFVADKAIGIGEYKDGIISYYNAYDVEDENVAYYAHKFTKEETNTILNSSKTNTIKIKVDKLKFTSGFDTGSLDYSHVTFIEIIK